MPCSNAWENRIPTITTDQPTNQPTFFIEKDSKGPKEKKQLLTQPKLSNELGDNQRHANRIPNPKFPFSSSPFILFSFTCYCYSFPILSVPSLSSTTLLSVVFDLSLSLTNLHHRHSDKILSFIQPEHLIYCIASRRVTFTAPFFQIVNKQTTTGQGDCPDLLSYWKPAFSGDYPIQATLLPISIS